jgi:pyridoxamine--pyruvate transaminase
LRKEITATHAAGLSLLWVNKRAWDKMKANPDAPRASMLSVLDWEEARRHDKPFPFTPSVAEINGLDAALGLYLEEGPENVWARHALTTKACRAGVRAMGLRYGRRAKKSPRRHRRGAMTRRLIQELSA